MLPFVIVVSNRRDISTHELGLSPFDARSIALSVLLGSHPPVLPARALVALAGLFGIAGGTTRTALSRMVAAGELELAEGRYRLAGRLLERQRSQDLGRRSPAESWNGHWHTVIAAPDQRRLAERRRFRAAMGDARFGELRPDIWMRPANLAPPDPSPELILTTGPVEGVDPSVLRDRLWDLAALHRRATAIEAALAELDNTLDWDDPRSIPPIFTTSAAAVRYLRDDPLLPSELAPAGWPAAALRTRYDRTEAAFQRLLRGFLSAVG
jgi:phenylacetic acid degradation operon negative regulatory protein